MRRRLLRLVYDPIVLAACVLAVVLMPLRLVRRLLTRGQTRSLWAGTPIINMAINARAERRLGVDARSLVYTTYYITDEFDYDLSAWSRLPGGAGAVPLFVFLWACLTADRLHFYCDRGLLPPRRLFTFDFRELYVYRLLRIPVFLWTFGADVRSRDLSMAAGEPNCCSECDAPGRHCICDPVQARRNIAALSRLSSAMFAGLGDMFGFTPSRDDTFFWPIDLETDNGRKYRPVYPESQTERPVRIVHAPNHRKFKGTRYLIDAVDELRREGMQIDLVIVERMSNREAIEIYRSADLIFDQCIMGNFGFFALEGLALGKPVMCFIRKPSEYLLAPEECPIVNTHIATLRDDLRRLLLERHRFGEIGRLGRRYIEKHFSLDAFAGRLKRTYADLGMTP